MEIGVTKLIAMLMVLSTLSTRGKLDPELETPPTLKSGESFLKFIRLTYTEKPDVFRIMTLKFRVSPKGNLDSLILSNNVPAEFSTSIRNQLSRLNGQWKSQLQSAPKTASKWLMIRFYVSGYRDQSNDCLHKQEADFMDAYQREADLFECTRDISHPVKCNTEYLAGKDYFLFPPWLSRVER